MNKVITLAFLLVLVSVGCVLPNGDEGKTDRDGAPNELTLIPDEFTIYQDYIKTIGGKPRVSDIGTIEATVISITKSEACPDKTDPFAPEPTECSVEPYPKDLGVVKINKIINYTSYSEQTAESIIEQPSEEKSLAEGEISPGYKGSEDLLKSKLPIEYEPLQEGQEVQTFFLLTTRPTKIRYISIKESKGGPESVQLPEAGTQQTVSQQVEPGKNTFKLIPKDGDYFVFTTKIGKFPGTIEKVLPSLEVGSKFRAEIYYDGSLYVGEYEMMDGEK